MLSINLFLRANNIHAIGREIVRRYIALVNMMNRTFVSWETAQGTTCAPGVVLISRYK
jgi:hypothetical protein